MNCDRDAVRTVWVRLGSRGYPVTVEPGCLDGVGRLVAEDLKPTSVAVVTGRGAVERYAERVAAALRATGYAPAVVRVPSGERFKTLRTVEGICRALAAARLDRRSLIIAVGGGVIGDMAGFAAAVYMRGIGVVQAPTTLLAQVDASVGGKTGVNLPAGKNLIGAFHQPRAVLADPLTLATLPAREIRCGLAEIIKHGLIHDAMYFEEVQRDLRLLLKRHAEALTRAVVGSCRIKADVVAADETEQGLRAVLNFGHTVGHALEALMGYRSLRHGEAVAMGMVAECHIGEEMGITPSNVTQTVREALRSAQLPHAIPRTMSADDIPGAMGTDKKSERGTLRFVLLRDVGNAEPGFVVAEAVLRRAIQRTIAA